MKELRKLLKELEVRAEEPSAEWRLLQEDIDFGQMVAYKYVVLRIKEILGE